MDEHRLGLHPILRRVWVKMGEQPIISNFPTFEPRAKL